MKDLNQNPNNGVSMTAFFELAFRPFFLFASLFSIAALVGWAAFWNGSATLNVYGGAMWWHIHEMLFGFAATVVVGFLLTAVQNWTGVRWTRFTDFTYRCNLSCSQYCQCEALAKPVVRPHFIANDFCQCRNALWRFISAASLNFTS